MMVKICSSKQWRRRLERLKRSALSVVVAAGAWVTKLFPDLGRDLRPERTAVVYLDPPADLKPAWDAAPVVLDVGGDTDGYIIPPSGEGGLKFGTGLHKRPTDDADADRAASARPFAPTLVPSHAGAFAITVHKSQGSEYGEVGLVLATGGRDGFLSRQLVYTAVSRARERVDVWADREVVGATVATKLRRLSGLRLRI